MKKNLKKLLKRKGPLAENEVKDLLKLYNIRTTKYWLVNKIEDLKNIDLRFPVALKDCSSKILNKKDVIPDIITSGSKKIAIRIPKNVIALRLLSEFGPLTITSANIHLMKIPEEIDKIKMQLKTQKISIYLNGGSI